MIGSVTLAAIVFDVPVLLPLALGVPLLLLLACAFPGLRRRLPGLFALAPVPALAAALLAGAEPDLVLGNAFFSLTFGLDAPGAMLLGVAAVLWIFAGAYAARWLRERHDRDGFIVCWLMTLTGSVGVFLAADLIGFYFLLAVLSVGASGLVLQGEGPDAFRASALYLGLALLAEAFLLAGLLLLALATPDGSLLIADAVAALPGSPWRDLTLLLLLVGLGMKAGLLPLHFWMPIAYGAAPIPAAAVMSGAVVKASIIALVRFLPFDAALPSFGLPLAALGLLGALYGVAIGITQRQPKLILAYSSVSQMGFLAAVIGMGLAAGDPGTALAAAFYAAHHLLVKGALFLAVGVVMLTGRRHLWPMLLPAAVIALGLGGLPLTGGALAKYAAKDLMGSGLAATVAVVSSIATTLLMVHFLRRLAADTAVDPGARAPSVLVVSWLAMALASVALPWALCLLLPLGALPEALSPAALWAALWPVLIGAAIAVGLDSLGRALPQIPAGDLGVALGRLGGLVGAAGRGFETIDTFARRWAVANIALLVVSLLFGYALMAQG
ncbi:proton-conducting transporter transmembrane domain-containing protein [Variovorax saccharolyticus]|uniref:proton-conducting transporter transmembrane domain-containing protein n=1 Tax=Variovorax saccharolyticus TaxID=3053516 RepID=UPI002574C61A|nr:proton-conducting transporter membrane subunit [Variovorax sp. J31P216]MDM0024807.1 proton-conducting transporter membrane subunit [Variovorax sp. J31P216]